MQIDTRRVQGRRNLHYDSLDDLLADAEMLVEGEIQQLGNWSPGRTLQHLARSLHTAIDGSPFMIPWPIKLILRTMKKRFLTKTLDPGFRLRNKAAERLTPDAAVGITTGLSQLKEAIMRLKSTEFRAAHAFLGNLTREEMDAFHLRHAEMHMSFLLPKNRVAKPSGSPPPASAAQTLTG